MSKDKNDSFKLFIYGLLAFLVMLLMSPGWASGDDDHHTHKDWDKCDHPRFVEHGCEEGGEQGPRGPPGPKGDKGDKGDPGEVPVDWINQVTNNHNTVNKWYRAARDAVAAEAAMQIHLPRDQTSRVTVGVSRLNSTTGYALGYAYMFDNERNTALTAAIGVAGEETAAKISFGFEFGGKRHMELPLAAVVIAEPEPEPEPVTGVWMSDSEYDDLVMAQVQQEDFNEQQQMVVDKFAQYDHLIEANQAQQRADDAEIERLKIEVAASKADIEARAAKRASVREKYLKKAEEKDNESKSTNK